MRPRTRSEASLRSAGFTLVEILVVVVIIAVLASLVLAGVAAATERSRRDQTQDLVQRVFLAVNTVQTTRNQLPQPDTGARLAYDASIDVSDPSQAGSYASWPVVNKLQLAIDFPIRERELVNEGGRVVLADAWGQPLRYVLGSGSDDNGLTPEKSLDGWNYRADDDRVLRSSFPYVWSYGSGNVDGSDRDAWIVALRDD